jgi:hypothetical protein
MVATASRERECKLVLRAWETRPTARGPEYRGVPGTWHDVRKVAGCPKGLVALVCCPVCTEVFALSDRVHTIDANGRVKDSVPCTRGTCSFRAALTLDAWNASTKPLYGVAIERWNGTEWVAEMHHTHANSEAEAREQCAHLRGTYRIVSAAPAVGFLADRN